MFSGSQVTFSRIDHISGNIASLRKKRKISRATGIPSNHNGTKLEINWEKKRYKLTDIKQHAIEG